MNKPLLYLSLMGALVMGASAIAAPLNVELVMSGDRSWKGQLVGRDGDWIEFTTGRTAKPIRIGANTIHELRFEVKIDEEKLQEWMNDREFDRIISVLTRTMKPFHEYSDVPSNLSKYNAVLMELYYRTQQFEESLAISSRLAEDARDPALQEKSRIYQALTLIDAGRSDDAEALLSKYGWDQDVSDDAAPEKLYITAKLMSLKKEYNQAMELVAKVIAFNSQDPQWMHPAELLCAEVYTELAMYESAEEVIRQISLLYKNTPEYDQAQELKLRIEQLRAEQELNENFESE